MNKNDDFEFMLRGMRERKANLASFDRFANVYDETRIVPNLVLKQAFSLIHNEINLRANRVILEAGIGTGKTCSLLSKYDAEVIGIDISSKMLRKCRERTAEISGKFGLIQGDIMCLPFTSSNFDIAMLMHVFFFLKGWKEAIREIRRVVKPGGFLIIMDYINPPLQSRIAKKYKELHRKNSFGNGFISTLNRLILTPVYDKVARLMYKIRFSSIEKTAISNNNETIEWTHKLQTSQSLNIFEKRPYPDYCDTPEKIQRKIMKELKKWIDETGVGDSEEIKCVFKISIFKF